MEKVTLEKLQSFGDVYAAIAWAKEQMPEYPTRIPEPVLKNGANSTEAKEYANQLEAYESKKQDYDQAVEDWQQQNNSNNAVIEQLIREESGLNDIPEKYRDKVYSYAYQQGHSSGLTEVYGHLLDLVEIFEQ